MILVSQTYEEVTQDSAEYGAASDSGFNFESQPQSFRELIDLMRVHRMASDSHDVTERTWFTESEGATDYATGAITSTSIHFCRENESRAVKYWVKAAAYVARRYG